jgi:hypothetical protein
MYIAPVKPELVRQRHLRRSTAGTQAPPSVNLPSSLQTVTAKMSNTNGDASPNAPPRDETQPYTITEQDGRINVAFTSGAQQGVHFQVDRPQPASDGQSRQPQEEPSHPVSYLDGNGNEISEEEYERLSMIEIAEESRMERERGSAQAERRS